MIKPKKSIIIFYTLTLMMCLNCFTSCSTNHQEKINTNVAKLAHFLNIEPELVESNFIFYDSNKVASLGLSFYYFYDSRDSIVYWNRGVLVNEINSQNSYCVSSKRPPMHSSLKLNTFEPALIKGDFFKNEIYLHKFDNAYLKRLSQSKKLESILNNQPNLGYSCFTRPRLDSLIRFFLFDPELLKNAEGYYSLITSSNKLDTIISKIEVENRNSKGVENTIALNSLKSFIDSNINNPNCFVYRVPSGIYLVTINEQFYSNEEAEKYSIQFSNGQALFQVKVYDYNYVQVW